MECFEFGLCCRVQSLPGKRMMANTTNPNPNPNDDHEAERAEKLKLEKIELESK